MCASNFLAAAAAAAPPPPVLERTPAAADDDPSPPAAPAPAAPPPPAAAAAAASARACERANRLTMTSLMCVCSAMQMSSPWRVSNWNTCSTPATRILKKTAEGDDPNCMMSRSSALWRYSLGTGRKKCTPRLLTPSTSFGGSSPIGSSARRTLKKTDEP